jgi:hypothetical protein
MTRRSSVPGVETCPLLEFPVRMPRRDRKRGPGGGKSISVQEFLEKKTSKPSTRGLGDILRGLGVIGGHRADKSPCPKCMNNKVTKPPKAA